jgi:hypothetical protein
MPIINMFGSTLYAIAEAAATARELFFDFGDHHNP